MMKMRWKKWLAGAMGLLLLAVLVPLGAAAQPEQVPVSTAQELTEILSQTQPEATQGKEYVLEADITLDTNTLRQGLNPEDIRVFAGTLQGGGHTITVTGPEASAPLFEQLRGSVQGLNLVFTGDVVGTPFAYDVGYSSPEDAVSLTELSVQVQGSVLFGDHDYSQYYGSLLAPPYNYGNWYIHYGGQPVHLATGFAWYLWGVSVSQVQVRVEGNIGDGARQEGDATAAGFAYFAVKGDRTTAAEYDNVQVSVGGSIQALTGDGHASAYGFAVGTADGSTVGFGGNNLDQVSYVSVTAQNILADSQQGASSAVGFARFVQGYTHHCQVNVPGGIRAVNQEGDQEEDQYAYDNGSAYAYGFMMYTGGWSIDSRRSFTDNTVNTGAIVATTQSEVYPGSAFACGFGYQLMNTANSVPDLSYNNNQVIVSGNVEASAKGAGAVAAGFVGSSGRDNYDRPDHIHSNTVSVGGSILATSAQADATAAGYSYKSNTHRRDCTVTVGGDIAATSPVQAVAAGFNGLQSIGTNYFIRGAQVVVQGNIQAVQTGEAEGIAVAGGLNGVVMGTSSGSNAQQVDFTGNRVEVYGRVLTEVGAKGSGCAGLLVGLNEHKDPAKGQLTIRDNTFVGQESLLTLEGEEGLYTNFTGISQMPAIAAAEGNRVVFLRDGECPYEADVTFHADSLTTGSVDVWQLSNQHTTHQAEMVEAVAPTCTEAGNIRCWYCSRCDSCFADEALTREISREDTVLPATGHDFAEAWSWDDENHFHLCKVCGEKQDVAGHAWHWIVDKEPTQTESGFKHQECSVCGYEREPVEIPPEGGENPTTEPTTTPTTETTTEATTAATDPNGPDQTGETAQPWLLAVLMVLSAGCVAVTLRRRIVK